MVLLLRLSVVGFLSLFSAELFAISVTQSSPLNGATTGTSVTVKASATPTSGSSITGWHIYVDSVDKYTGGAVSSISVTLSLSTGSHTITTRAWDGTGAYASYVASIKASSTTTSPTPTATPAPSPAPSSTPVSGGGGGSTTLAAETGNNTAASSAFVDRYKLYPTATYGTNTIGNNSDGVCGTLNSVKVCRAGHVSDRPLRSLFPSGTKVYVATQNWFNTTSSNISGGIINDNARSGSHIDIGYDSAANVNNQIADMKRRGIDGAIVNWYTMSKTSGQSLANFKNWTESHLDSSGNPTFYYAAGPDKGAFSSATGSTNTAKAVNIVETIYSNYINGTKGYIRDPNGNPVIYWFVDTGTSPSITDVDWASVKNTLASVGYHPVFLFDKTAPYSSGNLRAGTDGGYAWSPSSGLSSLTSFYSSSETVYNNNHGMHVAGGFSVGFNDTLATWSGNRINKRNCGQTWLNMINASVNEQLSGRLPPLKSQVISTWDDYEEGSEIETGIDNCVSKVNVGLSGSTLSWSLSFSDTTYGTENTVDSYVVWISSDGSNITNVGRIPTGTHSVSLTSLSIPSGTWKVYVEAVGKPSIVNHMSSYVTYTH